MRWEDEDARAQCNYRSREHQAQHFDAVEALLPPLDGLTLLDVGCGYGDFTNRLPPDMKDRYLGIDIDRDVIKAAKETAGAGWKFRWQKKIVPADVIVAIASLANDHVMPDRMLADMWENCSKAVVFTVYEHFAPMERLIRWCPRNPDVLLASNDFFTGALYK